MVQVPPPQPNKEESNPKGLLFSLFYYRSRILNRTTDGLWARRANNSEGEAGVNDTPGACQSRRTDRSIFSAEKMQERVVQVAPSGQPFKSLETASFQGFCVLIVFDFYIILDFRIYNSCL